MNDTVLYYIIYNIILIKKEKIAYEPYEPYVSYDRQAIGTDGPPMDLMNAWYASLSERRLGAQGPVEILPLFNLLFLTL